VQDIITEDEVKWHMQMCKLSEEKEKRGARQELATTKTCIY